MIMILVLTFVAEFELSQGPILWIYLAETMTNRGCAIALALNYIFTILISVFSYSILSQLDWASFLIYAGFNLLVY